MANLPHMHTNKNDTIEYVLKHERFPFTSTEKFTLIGIAVVIIAAAIWAMFHYHRFSSILIISAITIVLLYLIYIGIASAMAFHPIPSSFDQDRNKKIIQMCLAHLNIKAYRDKDYDNVFVCFIHDKFSNEREDIYIIAKENKILINSNKDKDSDEDNKLPDFVEKIGLSIYITVKKLEQLERKK